MIKMMSKKLIRKSLDMIRKLAEEEEEEYEDEDEYEDEEVRHEEEEVDEERDPFDESITDYAKFWKHFGKNMKLGVIEDTSNRQKLAKLLR